MNRDIEYYMNLPYRIVLIPEDDPDDGVLAEIPDLPGCFTAGDTAEEALALIKDAQRAWLEVAIEFGDPIPEPQPTS
jgi:antitoxin HicB